MKVKSKTIGNVRSLVYSYSAGPYMSFCFYTLAEVGQPWQKEAQQKAEQVADILGMSIKYGVEINQSPWIVDVLEKKQSPLGDNPLDKFPSMYGEITSK